MGSGHRRGETGPGAGLRAVPPGAAVAVAAGVAALSATASTARAFSAQADVVTALGIALLWGAALAGSRRRRVFGTGRRAPGRRPGWRGAIPWICICAAAGGFELFEYSTSPRRAHPTLSFFLTSLTSHEAGRGVAYLCWIVLGLWIALRSSEGLRAAGRARR
ncbi:MAG: hypothetical protein ACRD0B_13010 [Acidimicrobiales bacterium]